MSVKELKKLKTANTYAKTEFPLSKGIIKNRAKKGKEQLVSEINNLMKEKSK